MKHFVIDGLLVCFLNLLNFLIKKWRQTHYFCANCLKGHKVGIFDEGLFEQVTAHLAASVKGWLSGLSYLLRSKFSFIFLSLALTNHKSTE